MTDGFDIDLPGNAFLSATKLGHSIDITAADCYGSPAASVRISLDQARALAKWLNKAASGRAEPDSHEQERNTAARTAGNNPEIHGSDE